MSKKVEKLSLLAYIVGLVAGEFLRKLKPLYSGLFLLLKRGLSHCRTWGGAPPELLTSLDKLFKDILRPPIPTHVPS